MFTKNLLFIILSFIPLALTVGVIVLHWVRRKQTNAVLDVLETYADPLSGSEIQRKCVYRISDNRLIDILWDLHHKCLIRQVVIDDQPLKWVLCQHADYGLDRNL